jgi:hypothetical protein
MRNGNATGEASRSLFFPDGLAVDLSFLEKGSLWRLWRKGGKEQGKYPAN